MTASLSSDRTSCLVPFCRRTRKPKFDGEEWICGDHWRGVPKRVKRRYSAARRIHTAKPSPKSAVLCGKLWKRCKDEAVVGAAHVI